MGVRIPRDAVTHSSLGYAYVNFMSPEDALKAMDHVVLLPHVGSGSHHTRRLMGQLVVDNIVSWFAGKGPLTPVAETPWPKPA
jgi:lactate dehydrogenase-like 2-hydroxyacid dehydrogenase